MTAATASVARQGGLATGQGVLAAADSAPAAHEGGLSPRSPLKACRLTRRMGRHSMSRAIIWTPTMWCVFCKGGPKAVDQLACRLESACSLASGWLWHMTSCFTNSQERLGADDTAAHCYASTLPALCTLRRSVKAVRRA